MPSEIADSIPHIAIEAERYAASRHRLRSCREDIRRRDIHVFDFRTMMGFGSSGSSINGMKFAAPRLAFAITRDLFTADIEPPTRR